MRRRALALRMFVRRAAECVASAVTDIPAIDAIVFTGGIGETAAGIRARIVARLASLGVAPILEVAPDEDEVIPAADRAGRRGSAAAPVVLRIVAREDLIVAREAARLVEANTH